MRVARVYVFSVISAGRAVPLHTLWHASGCARCGSSARRYAGVAGACAGRQHASLSGTDGTVPGPRSCRARPAQGRARRKNLSGVSAAIVVTVGYAVYRVISDHEMHLHHASVHTSALPCLANGFPEHTHTTSQRLPRCYVCALCAAASLRLRLKQGPHVSTVIDASLSEHHEAERRVDQPHAADAEPQREYGSGARRRSAHA